MPDVLGVIICDGIRQENNGKLILVGVYTGTMIVQQFAFGTELAMAAILGERTEKISRVKLRVGTTGGAEFVDGDFALPEPQWVSVDQTLIPLPPVPVVFSTPDVLEVRIGLNGGEERLVGRLKIERGVIPS